MTRQVAALLFFTSCGLMIGLVTLTSSGFFGSVTLWQFDERDQIAGRNRGDMRRAQANWSDPQTSYVNGTSFAPSLAYEETRRKVENGVEEMWCYVSSQFRQLQNSVQDDTIKERIHQILELAGDQHRSIVTDIYKLSQVDGFSSWKQRKLKELSDLIQQRLFYLQNPTDCTKAKKIVCNFNTECGFGCQVHHLSYCMLLAYGTERTLILHSKGWSYVKGGWEKFFLPLSETCLDDSGNTKAKWGDQSSNEKFQVLEPPLVGYLPQNIKPDFLPLAIPKDISQTLMRAHGNPAVWWIGQIMKFIMRLQPDVREYIENQATALGFTHPIVGIHVRRTDKLVWEAKFHGIEEYMAQAEEFYKRLERRQDVSVRRIYLATDDTNLLEEAKQKYPKYVFLSQTAAGSSRYTEDSLKRFLVDLHLLARSDYLVCTFSSNVGRLVYEMMQGRNEDTADKAFSLDGTYFFHGQNDHVLTAMYEHRPQGSNEIELQPGDTVIFDDGAENRNLRNGYSKGINQRLQRTGLYPTYKVEDKTKIVNMPTYREVANEGSYTKNT